MHTEDDENYERGYEWWLMKEAKKASAYFIQSPRDKLTRSSSVNLNICQTSTTKFDIQLKSMDLRPFLFAYFIN